jgi:hypothetical protein
MIDIVTKDKIIKDFKDEKGEIISDHLGLAVSLAV